MYAVSLANMTLWSFIRSGLIFGAFLLFAIVIGLYGVLEGLTLSGIILTAQGATASEIAAQKPTLTNPPFARALTVTLAVIVGWVMARRSKRIGTGLLSAVVTNAVAGVLIGLFIMVMNALFDAEVNVTFVLEKVTPALIRALSFDLPAATAGLIWMLVLAAAGALGAGLAYLWQALHLAQTRQGRTRARIPPALYRNLVLAVILLFLTLAPLQLGIYWNQVLGSIGLFVLLGLGLNIVVGFAGLLDLGYVGFYAIGAYTIATLTAPVYQFQWSFWQALPLAMIAAAIAGVLLGIPVLRLRGDYLAIVTLGFGEIIRILYKFNPYTGGPQGILNVAAPTVCIPSTTVCIEFTSSTPFYYLILIASILVAFVAVRLNDSRIGRAWTAMREDEDATEAMGIDTTRAKLLAFGIGALFAGMAGAIYASRQQHIFPDDFTLLVSINALALIIIGGLGSIPGVIIGSVVLIGLPEVLRPVADYRLLFYAALLIVMMLIRPEGLLPSRRRQLEIHERDEELATIESA